MGTFLKRVVVALSCLALVALMLPVVPAQFAGASSAIGKVRLSIEDSTPRRDDLVGSDGKPFDDPGPQGYFVEPKLVDLYADDTMMSVITRVCDEEGLEVVGAESNYISSIAERAEFDRGPDSGWMGCINSWYVNAGFADFSVAKGDLQAGDTIEVKYTTDLGDDIGAGMHAPATKELMALSVYPASSDGVWDARNNLVSPSFDPQVHEYWATLPADGKVAFLPRAANQVFQVRMNAGGSELRWGHVLTAQPGTDVTIICGDPSWPSMRNSQEPAQTYTVHLSAPELVADGLLAATCTNAEGDLLDDVQVDYEDGTFTVTPPMMRDDEATNPTSLLVTLPGLPDGVEASLIDADGNQMPTEGGVFDLSEQLGRIGKHVNQLVIESGGTTERARVIVDRSAALNPVIPSLKLSTDSHDAREIEGFPPCTPVKLGSDGAAGDEAGWNPAHGSWRVWVPASASTIELPVCTPSMGVARIVWNGGVRLEVDSTGHIIGSTKLHIADTTSVLEIRVASRGEVFKTYNIEVVRAAVDAEAVVQEASALPPADDVAYGRDHDAIELVSALYGMLDDAQKAQVPQDVSERIEACNAACAEQEAAGLARIDELCEKIAYFQQVLGERSSPLTDKLYKNYGHAVAEAQDLQSELSGWVRAFFAKECGVQSSALINATWLVRRYEMTHGLTVGRAFSYTDDFMVSSNAYNLDLGANERAYEITFRDVMKSSTRGSETCMPFNTPGRVKYEIADESVVGIEEVDTFYIDKGLGGGNAQIRDMRYYLVPKKPGTTTITATTVDETAGTYYGQVPEIIVHVNTPEETAASGDVAGSLAYRLADIAERPRSTKYDTWHFDEGTEGADYTFKVSGSGPEVAVWEYLGEGKASYPVAADGTVTVKLKDGYNPIEVTSTLDGERVTQVYGVRGKAVRTRVLNETRPGEKPRLGDTVSIRVVGTNTPVHKILRIYNPSGGDLVYSSNLKYQSDMSGSTTTGIDIDLTSSGTARFFDGHVYQDWWGSPLYSEAAQGNTGEIAPTFDGAFSTLPDISFEVAENPYYKEPELKSGSAVVGGPVKAGETATVRVPELDIAGLTSVYHLDYQENEWYNRLREAWTVFSTTIPGVKRIESEHWLCEDYGGTSGDDLSALKTVSFTVPADTSSGEYQIKGGYVRLKHGEASWGVFSDDALVRTIGDCTITVVNEKMDAEAVEQVEGAIAAIGKVTDLSQAAAVTAARAAYDAMTERQKSLVGNYQLLLDAERAIEQLKSGKAPDGKPTAGKAAKDNAAKAKAAAEAKAKKVKSVTVNAKTVTTKTVAKAIKKAGGKAKYVETVVLGRKVAKVSKGALKKLKKAKTLVVKTKKLTKKSIKGSLKGSKVKTVKVKVSGSKKANKKYAKKYKKVFTKKNCGKKVKVK